MIEHIKTIVDQVNIPHQVGDNCRMVSDQELEKFAELIVKECVETLETFEDYWPHEQQMNLLKKHFGVEE